MNRDVADRDVDELGRKEMRCEWCDLRKVDCCCNSPSIIEYGQCGSCGLWRPNSLLEIRDEDRTVLYAGCKGGCPI